MAYKGEITKITLPNGDEYDIKDSVARSAASAGFSLIVVEELPEASEETTGGIYLIASSGTGENNNYIEYVTVFKNGEYSWEQIGSTSVDLNDYSKKDHTHTVTTNVGIASISVTPEGTVSQPIFTGAEGDVSVSGTPKGSVTIGTGSGTTNYTPAGTVSAPTITADITDNEGETLTAYSMDSTGSYTPSSFTNGSYTASVYTPESYSVSDENLILTASQYTKETVTMPQYTSEAVVLPTRKQMKVSAVSSTPSFTGTGVELTAEFTGTATSSTGKFTPSGTVSQPTFTGTAASHTHEVTNATVTSGIASK